MKHELATQVQNHVPSHLAGQNKDIVIYEVVRIVMRETNSLGFILQPSMKPETHRAINHVIIDALVTKYAQYTMAYASISDVVTDLIDELAKNGLSLSEVAHV